MLAVAPGTVRPGLLAFLVVAGLGVATFFLLRSMNSQLGKINFDEGGEADSREADGGNAPPASGSERPGTRQANDGRGRDGGNAGARHDGGGNDGGNGGGNDGGNDGGGAVR